MTAYRYTAADAQGRETQGVIEADSARQARQALRQQTLIPLRVETVESSSPGTAGVSRRRLPPAQLAVLTRQFASLLAAALPIADALNVLVEQSESQSQRELLASIRTEVRGGLPLSAALGRHARQFPPIYRALIAAGEESGRLGSVMGALADYLEERARLQQKITLAFVYPVILTSVSVLVVVFLLTYVVPQVVEVFSQTHQALPLITRIMIGISGFLRSDGWILAILLVAAGLGAQRALRVPGVRLAWHRRLLRLPVIGALVRSLDTARFASTLAILSGSGVPMLRSLQAASETMANLALQTRVELAIQRVREGSSLARALRAHVGDGQAAGERLFPPVLIHMIGSGETTGKLPEMLGRAADMHAREAERRTLMFTSLLEPALILVMGLIVMLIVLAVLMPIIEINQLAR